MTTRAPMGGPDRVYSFNGKYPPSILMDRVEGREKIELNTSEYGCFKTCFNMGCMERGDATRPCMNECMRTCKEVMPHVRGDFGLLDVYAPGMIPREKEKPGKKSPKKTEKKKGVPKRKQSKKNVPRIQVFSPDVIRSMKQGPNCVHPNKACGRICIGPNRRCRLTEPRMMRDRSGPPNCKDNNKPCGKICIRENRRCRLTEPQPPNGKKKRVYKKRTDDVKCKKGNVRCGKICMREGKTCHIK